MERKECDICIIGAGINGCALAEKLSKLRKRIIVVEAKSGPGAGTTRDSHHNLLSGIRYVLDDISLAKECWQANKEFRLKYSELIQGRAMPKFWSYWVGKKNIITDRIFDGANDIGINFREANHNDADRKIMGLDKEKMLFQAPDCTLDFEELCKLYYKKAQSKDVQFVWDNTAILNDDGTVKIKDCLLKARVVIVSAGTGAKKLLGSFVEGLSLDKGLIVEIRGLLPRIGKSIQLLEKVGDGDACIYEKGRMWLGTTAFRPEENNLTGIKKMVTHFSSWVPALKESETGSQRIGFRTYLGKAGRKVSKRLRIVNLELGKIQVLGLLGGKASLCERQAKEVVSKIEK